MALQPADFVGRVVMRYEGNVANYKLELVSNNAAFAQNPRAVEIDAKTGQVKVLPGPPAALAAEFHFTLNHARQVFASFEDIPKALLTIPSASEHLAKMRDMGHVFNVVARSDKTVIMGREEFTMVAFDAVRNVVKVRPKLHTAPLDGWEGHDRELTLVMLKDMRVVHLAGRPAPTPPVTTAPPPAVMQPMTQTVLLQKDTFTSKAGNPTCGARSSQQRPSSCRAAEGPSKGGLQEPSS